jgi:hypothetical protein
MRRVFLLGSATACLFIILGLNAWCQTPSEQKPVVKVRIDNDLGNALRELAGTYEVVIGFEEIAAPGGPANVKIKLDGAPFQEALAKVLAADPRYASRQGQNGAVHVFRRGVEFNLPDLTLSSVVATSFTRHQVEDLLFDSPEVRGWASTRGCTRIDPVITAGYAPSDVANVTLDLRGQSLREALDQAALEAHTYFWRVVETNSHGKCHVSIMLPAAHIPPAHIK